MLKIKYDTLINNKSTNKYCNNIYIKLLDLHNRLKAKCYKKYSPKYQTYGGRGVTISEDWKDTDTFIKESLCLEGFNSLLYLQGKLHLDKDIKIHDSRIYSKETCIWVTNDINEKYKTSRWHNIYAYNYQQGFLYIFNSLNEFLKRKNISVRYGTSGRDEHRVYHNNWILWDKNRQRSSITEYIYISPSGIKVRSLNQSKLSRYIKPLSNSLISKCKVGEIKKLESKIIIASYDNRVQTFNSFSSCSKFFHVGRDFLTKHLKKETNFYYKNVNYHLNYVYKGRLEVKNLKPEEDNERIIDARK